MAVIKKQAANTVEVAGKVLNKVPIEEKGDVLQRTYEILIHWSLNRQSIIGYVFN